LEVFMSIVNFRSCRENALSFTALLLVGLLSRPVVAQEVWIGRPTIGDYVRRDVADVLLAMQRAREAGKSKIEFNETIGQARRAYFETAKQPNQRAAAEKRFSDLLNQKDNHLLLMELVAGPAPSQGMRLSDAYGVLTGGALDGGVKPSARPSFDRWVDGMRTSLGGKANVTDQMVAKAIVDNADLYEQYKVQRDKAEIDAFVKLKKEFEARRVAKESMATAKTADGSLRLHTEKVSPLADRSSHFRTDLVNANQPLRMLVAQAVKDGQQVLDCTYGPGELWADGTAKFEKYKFWHHNRPAQIDNILAAHKGALGKLGPNDKLASRLALDKCPSNNREAQKAAAG
jgi:hypothetical protein